mmetsp:Transcript_31046/g.30499  ORF Transcript_31046/g.30499 Transcript_31046/m.30499 type:complete len:106 (-) Transcript_31046:76-393(-)
MNPICKCCGYYCALMMFIGIFFFSIIIVLEYLGTGFMGLFNLGSIESFETQGIESVYALLINIAGVVCCLACTIAQDKKVEELDDEDMHLQEVPINTENQTPEVS